MVLASQIENKERQIIGVISATINLKPLQALVYGITLGEEGYVYIVDKEGNLITNYGLNILKPGDSLKNIALVADVMRGRSHNGLTKFETYSNTAGEEVVFAGRPLNELGWFILSEWPRDDAFSVIDNILKISLIITVLTLVLVVVLSLFMVGQIVKPINSLYHAAKHIESGDFNYRLRVKTKDEFEVLANKFNEMIKVLAENRKLRDEFVFIAAHELRTPVTAIRGYISMILEKTFGEVPEKIRENLLIVNQSNDRLVQLVSDLLEVARSEAGKMKVEIVDIPMAENVVTVVNELKSLSEKKGIKVSYEKPEPDVVVKADSYKLKEVLTNLIGNAIKYTIVPPASAEASADKGDIIVKHEIKDKELITHITDHGIGMTPEEVEKLFGKFFRAQNQETKNIEGTGLGLFICKEIIERMGGKIWVTSEKGKGSTFSFSLQIA
jgi:signal transduction histidine kinase